MRRGQFAVRCRVLVVGGVVVADVLVVGLDLVTGLEVHAGDRETREWRKKGHERDSRRAGR
jgi:hypothetical protein